MSLSDFPVIASDEPYAAVVADSDANSETADVPGPEVLYHYTGPAGLHGILHSAVLWGTEAPHLNDTSEIHYTAELLGKALLAKASALPPLTVDELAECAGEGRGPYATVPRSRAIQSAANLLMRYGKMPGDLLAHNPYPFVVSFSEKGDSLSQWRGYGEQGGGFAIGFRRDALKGATYPTITSDGTERQLKATAPTPVQYGKKARRRRIEVFCRLTLAEGSLLAETTPTVRHMPYVFGLTAKALTFCATHKSRAFKAEREWRTIATVPGIRPKIEYRPGGPAGLIPYISLGLPPNCVEEVVIGPSKDQALRVRMVKQLLAVNGYKGVKVRKSAVAFRR